MRQTLLCLALTSAVFSANAANLSDIYKLARSNDTVYAAAYAGYQAGLEKLPQGKALLRPNIIFRANISHSETDLSNLPGGFLGHDPYDFLLQLTQPLYRKQNLENYEQSKLQTLLAEQQLRLAEQDLFLRVSKAYFAVLEAQDNLATAQSQKQAIAEQLALAKRSFEVGAATIVDTHEAQARFDATVAQELVAENDLEVKGRALEKIILAQAPALDKLLPDAAIRLPEPANMGAWVKQAEENSLLVATYQTAQEIANRVKAMQHAGNFPTLDLFTTYIDRRNDPAGVSSVDQQAAKIGMTLEWNLYQGGATDSRIREAVANQEKARFDLENARRQAALDTRQAYLGVISGNARVKALAQALISTETQLKSTKLGQEVGVRTGVDVLNAQQQRFAAQRDLASARYAAILSGLQLKAAAGALGEDDIKGIDQYLQAN